MAKYTSARALAAGQGRRFDQIAEKAKRLHNDLAREMMDETEKLTSGKTSTKELRRLGHPFGRRAGWKSVYNPQTGKWRQVGGRQRGKLSTLPINRQTGRLQRSFKARRKVTGAMAQQWSITNAAPYAQYVLSPSGTTKMVARPYQREMRKLWREKNKRLKQKLRQLPRDITR